ncbi:TPA: hypothetical protein HA235_07975 [Candidatus Woesearchaeota archaeon]|nr:hypothetical protein [Candidatus Woesearchaeota archaeon]HIH32614.1 hypothetical protein [Candidatus Woesearchaeota archaeon]HIH54837.1 hypothetical protein [Candidatus Woesearchaeota archaeon]HIJ01616.1 hypothetical protein [Candidatus Woesearchaeota archaeon]HIJ13713.1 hypothetical protein [Candidatus Woesearchaeota archaeon]
MRYAILLIMLSLFIVGCTTTTVVEDTSAPEVPKNTTTEVASPPPEPEPEVITGYTGIWLAGKKSFYIEYTQEAYEIAVKEDKLILLNFYNFKNDACVNDNAQALKAFTSMDYGDVIGFRVDFNNDDVNVEEKNIALKYGVAADNTKVIVKGGKRVFKEVVNWEKDDFVYAVERNRG